MKTKCFKLFFVAALFVAALCVNGAINMDSNSNDVKLSDLATTTEANAECSDESIMVTGHCSEFFDYCRLEPDRKELDCDYYYRG